MNKTSADRSPVILVIFALLFLYNGLYWSSKFLGFLSVFQTEVVKHWKLITFLEFLAVASIAADCISQYDRFNKREALLRIVGAALLGGLLLLRILFGVMELYMRGEVGSK